MTNKPMLSVERELLEIYTGRKEGDWVEAGHELRALLDEPSDDPNLGIEMMRGAGSGLLIQDHGGGWQAVTFNRGVRVSSFPIKGGYREAVAALTAAQHQGEPVAWIVTDMNGDSYFAYDRQTPNDKPLYAEQPAPVAVAMPERDELIEMLRHFASCANVGQVGTGAMDFVARMNGVKP